jgi:hypothetical protein
MISVEPIILLLFQLRDDAQEEQERLAHEDAVGKKWMRLEKKLSAITKAIQALQEDVKA